MPPLILASTSPQRKKILEIYSINYISIAPQCDETLMDESAVIAAQRIAVKKCEDVLHSDPSHRKLWILSADTLISLGNDIIGKPADKAEAERILRRLSGVTHRVITGTSVYVPTVREIQTGYEETEVQFNLLSESEIQWYLNTNEWKGAAGGYRIQDRGEYLVSSINGSYGNVVGLPIHAICAIVAPYISDACPLCNLPGFYNT